MRRRLFLGTFLILFLSVTAFAEVRLPQIFSSNMVLQREMKVPVWGWADAGEKVTVSVCDQTGSTETGADGRWKLELNPLKPGGPFTMTVKGKNELKLENVLVGDVWLCSGQSNMAWTLSRSDNASAEIEKSANTNIRLVQVDREWKTTPQTTLPTKGWTECAPETTPSFTAVGYFFGKKLNADLNVPIGLINSSWGGTRIEPWTTPYGFQQVPSLAGISEEVAAKDPATDLHKKLVTKTLNEYKQWVAATEKSLTAAEPVVPPPPFPSLLVPFENHQRPTVLHNAMVHPFAPLAMKGVIWYQGESNRGEGMLYAEKMKALIAGWRNAFNNPQLGFYYVQLAPYIYAGDPLALPLIWEAQASVEKSVPLTGMAVINDVGNIKDIHPTDKKTVGERLALLALNRTYGKTEVVCASPELDSMSVEDNTVILRMKNARELKTRDGKAPDWFEIAGADGLYKKADVQIAGTTLRLTNPMIAQPYAVRFAWDQIAEPNLQNEAGLPLGAFRAGEIPERGRFDTLVPDAKKFKLLYSFDPTRPVMIDENTRIVYATDKSKEIAGKVKRVGYFLYLQKKDEKDARFVFVTMPPQSDDLTKLGVPTKASGVRLQKKVNDVTVASNVPGVKTGTFAGGCNIEFWDCNYGPKNSANIDGASDAVYDFGDDMAPNASPGYGSMQVHNFAAKQTIFAFNNFKAGTSCDVGIGNDAAGKHPDWTFSGAADQCDGGQFLILVEME